MSRFIKACSDFDSGTKHGNCTKNDYYYFIDHFFCPYETQRRCKYSFSLFTFFLGKKRSGLFFPDLDDTVGVLAHKRAAQGFRSVLRSINVDSV